jgi:nucleoside-diphosphate-sugar epimerase
MSQRTAVVTGAAGFLGRHLVEGLRKSGRHVVGVDRHPPLYGTDAHRFVVQDCRDPGALEAVVRGADEIFALAADMGGMGYISQNHAAIMRNNTLINLATIECARRAGVPKIVFTSSACVYPEPLQADGGPERLTEAMALPAQPEGGYGWEKLYAERLYLAHAEAGLETRIARLHNVYGPFGAWTGGREKAPAALARKVAHAALHGERHIEIWGDGRQVRSFCYVSDCIDGLLRLADSDLRTPVNIGRDDPISVDDLAQLVMHIAGVQLELVHVPGPEGVRARNADETLARSALGWRPTVDLESGMRATYTWVAEQVRALDGGK